MRRLLVILPVMTGFAIAALAGCRSEPAVAAYIEEIAISHEQLSDAVEQRLSDENIAAVVEPGDTDYQRTVLSQLVQQASYRLLSARYEVSITEREVQERLDQLLASSADVVDDVYSRIAAEQRLSRIDVRETVRQILIREAIAVEEGLGDPIQEAALQQRFEEIKDQLTTIELGFITVPDQATADTTLAALLADPNSYPSLAETYAGPDTQPTLRSAALSEVPPPLLPSVAQTAAGQGFTVAIPETGGIVVGYVASLEVPTFEQSRDQIRSEAASGVDAAVGPLVAEFLASLDIDINPRYGSLDQGRVVPGGEGGVVRILEDADAAASQTP